MPTRDEVQALRQRIQRELWTHVMLEELEEHELEGVPETDLFTVYLMFWIAVKVGRRDRDMSLIICNLDKVPERILSIQSGEDDKYGKTAKLPGLVGLNEKGEEIELIGSVIERRVQREDGTEVTRDAVLFRVKTCDHIFELINHLARAFYYPYF